MERKEALKYIQSKISEGIPKHLIYKELKNEVRYQTDQLSYLSEFPDLKAQFQKQEVKTQEGKAQDKWVKVEPTSGPPLDHSDIQPTLYALFGMRAGDVLDPAQEEALDLASASYRAQISLSDGGSYELVVAPKGDDQYVGTVKGSKHLYVISKSTIDRSFNKLKELLEGGPAKENEPQS